MQAVEPWPGYGTNYSSVNWMRLILVAKVIQKEPPKAVEALFYHYQLIGSTNQDFQNFNEEQLQNDTKLFLLMRVIFQLPEALHADKKSLPIFGGWMGRWPVSNGEINSNGTFSIAWPMKWSNGHPKLIAGWLGLQGIKSRYNAVDEYKYFLQNYPMRDLSLFK
jgi:hypothetical protein